MKFTESNGIHNCLKRWAWPAAAGLACCLALGAQAPAQIDLGEALLGPSDARAQWEQKVLSRNAGTPAMVPPGVGYSPPGPAAAGRWGPYAGWNAPQPTGPGPNALHPFQPFQANPAAGAPTRAVQTPLQTPRQAPLQTPAQLTGFRARGYAWANQPDVETGIAPAPDPAAIGDGQTGITDSLEPIPTPPATEGPVYAQPGWGMDAMAGCASGGCGPAGCGPGGCATCGVAGPACGPEMVAGCGWGYGPAWRPGLGLGWWLLRRSSLWAGVQGFKGPLDFGRNGNFGIHEGVDFGLPLGGLFGVGVQVGFQAVHSNFEGDRALGALRTADRNQIFFTTGLFRRAMCAGLQWGVALDVLHDSYYDIIDLTQLRTELAWVFPSGWELGYWGAYGTTTDNLLVGGQQIGLADPTDQFLFYVRRYLPEGGEGRFWVGFTGEGDGLLGGELNVPLGRCWAIENRVGYLITRQGPAGGAQAEESWGLSMHLVWYPGRPARGQQGDPFRPLIPVADNATFMVDRGP